MFDSIVVPLDLDATGDRALPVARSLAALGSLPIELFTVSSPGLDPAEDTWRMDRCAEQPGIDRERPIRVLHSNDPAKAITARVLQRPDSLIVMASSAKGALRERTFGSVTEQVIADAQRPIVVLGPQAEPKQLAAPTLIACVDTPPAAGVALPMILSWSRTFPQKGITVATVVPIAGSDDDAEVVATAHVAKVAEQLAELGIAASTEVLRGHDSAAHLDRYANNFDDAVLVAASARWTGPAPRWHGTTRRLVRLATHPVLVVPATRVRAESAAVAGASASP